MDAIQAAVKMHQLAASGHVIGFIAEPDFSGGVDASCLFTISVYCRGGQYFPPQPCNSFSHGIEIAETLIESVKRDN